MATTLYRSIGTRAADSTGTVAVDVTGLVITLSGGTWNVNWGVGDLLMVTGGPGAFSSAFSNAFDIQSIFVLSRDSNTQLTLQTALPVALRGTSGNTYTISRAYSTLATWEAACPSNLVSIDAIWRGECYADSVFNEKLTITGTTVDSTHYVHLTAPVGQRHSGKAGAGVGITDSTTSTSFITISQSYTVFEWLSVYGKTATNGGLLLSVSSSPTNVTVRNCLFYDSLNTGAGGENNGASLSGTCYFYNNIIYNIRSTGIVCANGGTYYIFNNTLFDIGRQVAISSAGVSNNGNGSINLRNTIIIMRVSTYLSINGTLSFGGAVSDYNIYSDTPSVSYGAHSLVNKTAADVAFISTAGTKDYRLTSTSIAIGIGTNLGATYINDVTGESRRSSLWDIGAHQLTILSTVGTTGRDFSTATTWEAAAPSNLASSSGTAHIWRGECYKDSTFNEIVTVAGSISDSRYYKILTTGPGQKHTGMKNTGVKFAPSGTLAASSAVVTLTEDHSVVENLECTAESVASASYMTIINLAPVGPSGYLKARRNLVYDFPAALYQPGAMIALNASYQRMYVYNNFLFYAHTYVFPINGIAVSNRAFAHVYNNTVYQMAGYGIAWTGADGSLDMRNNIVIGSSGAADYSVTGVNLIQGYNMSGDTSITGTSGAITGASATNQFVSTTISNPDLHLKSTSSAIKTGTNLGSGYYVNIDIDEFDRTSYAYIWDMGAHQYTKTLFSMAMLAEEIEEEY